MLTGKLERFIDSLNEGFDESINDYIDSTYLQLTTLSAVFPTLSRSRPITALLKLSLVVFICVTVMMLVFLIFLGALQFAGKNFTLVMNQFQFIAIGQMGIQVMWHSWYNRSEEGALHELIADTFYDYGEELSDTWKSLRESIKKVKLRCIQSNLLIAFAVTSTLILIPTLNSFGPYGYTNTLHGVYIDVPIPTPDILPQNKPLSHFLIYVLEFLGASFVGLIMSTKCMMCIECNLSIQMNLKLLTLQYENIEARASNMHKHLFGDYPTLKGYQLYRDYRFSYCIDECLKKNIQHHQVIIGAVRKLNNVYGGYAFNFYLTMIVSIALSIFAVSAFDDFPGSAVGSITICITETFFAGLYCDFGQTLTNLGYNLCDEVYNIKWYFLNKKNKNTVKIIQIMSQRPFYFSYHDILKINYDSFARLINSAYSYYNLVNANT